MSEDVHNKKIIIVKIKKIVLDEWDPIGIQDIPEAQDEYDSYISDIYQLIQSKKIESELFDYLWELETEHMGLSGDRKRTQAIAHKLFKLSNSLSRES